MSSTKITISSLRYPEGGDANRVLVVIEDDRNYGIGHQLATPMDVINLMQSLLFSMREAWPVVTGEGEVVPIEVKIAKGPP